MLIFEDAKVRDAFDHRSKARSSGGHHQGGDAIAVCVKILCRGITVVNDNKEARHLVQNPVCASNSKHIDIRYQFLREVVWGEFAIVVEAIRRILKRRHCLRL